MNKRKWGYLKFDKNYIQLEKKVIDGFTNCNIDDYLLIDIFLSKNRSAVIDLKDEGVLNAITNFAFDIKRNDEKIKIKIATGNDIVTHIINSKTDFSQIVKPFYAWTGKYAIVYENKVIDKVIFDIDGNILQVLIRRSCVAEFEETIRKWAVEITKEDYLNDDKV